jgi:hypothetical protein
MTVLNSSDLEFVTCSWLEVIEYSMEFFDNNGQRFTVRSSLVMYVIISAVGESLGLAQRRVQPLNPDTGLRQHPRLQLNRCWMTF